MIEKDEGVDVIEKKKTNKKSSKKDDKKNSDNNKDNQSSNSKFAENAKKFAQFDAEKLLITAEKAEKENK